MAFNSALFTTFTNGNTLLNNPINASSVNNNNLFLAEPGINNFSFTPSFNLSNVNPYIDVSYNCSNASKSDCSCSTYTSTSISTCIDTSTINTLNNEILTTEYKEVSVINSSGGNNPIYITAADNHIEAITQATDITTLNVNNTIQIQNGETIEYPTQHIDIRSDNSGNRIGLDGNYGEIGNVLVSGGANGSVSWGSTTSGVTLANVLDNGNVAQKNLNMNGFTIENVMLQLDSLNLATNPVTKPYISSSGLVLPITLNGQTYYIQLFTSPP